MQDFYNALETKTTADVFDFDIPSDEENSLDKHLKLKGYLKPAFKY